MPKVSIIVPIYNKEKYLEKSISSILNQTLKNIEIILVNDGSKDNSINICRKFEKLDNRVKVIDQKNAGVSVARNNGILVAKGEYIGFVDPDDWIEKEMYSNMYNKCIETKSNICICNYYHNYNNRIMPINLGVKEAVITDKNIYNKIVLDMIAPECILNNSQIIMGSVWRLLINRNFLYKHKIIFPPGIPFMEDLIFCIKIFSIAKTICIDKENYYHYCIEDNTAATKYREDSLKLRLEVVNIIEKYLISKNLYDESKTRLIYRYINIGIGSIKNEVHKDNKKSLYNKLKTIKSICSHPKIVESLKSYYELNTRDLNKSLDLFKVKVFYKKTYIKYMFSKNSIMLFTLTKLSNMYSKLKKS
ncbi:MAG: glycosyltransferase [Bacilli bacterium]|nr:glycosyltransferase [Bacilli bacterium]MDD4733536.1 glycosyltransferase [Bacilli bacterium]